MCDSSDTTRIDHAPVPAPTRTFFGRCRATRTALLRTVAGQTVGFRAPARRGSFLILVVGILALLSVIAVLYATLGSSDRARASAIVHKKVLDDYPDRVRDYIAGVIGRDAVGAMPEVSPDGLIRFSRESFDYPFTNWQSTSALIAAAADKPLFTPTGDPRYLSSGNGNIEGGTPIAWIPGDPWLASNEPTFLDLETPGSSTNPSKLYIERRDWAHISNFGPDGRFINLALLRNNHDIDSRSLTANLTIPGRVADYPANLQNIPGTATPRDSHHPAHFDSMQIGAFRPMFDSRPPGDPNNIFNQWADADGDGFADSRWFEMVDATKNFPGGTDPSAEISILPRDSSIRYIIAVRAIDLSGLINVNTASDQKAAPASSRPIGSSPGEVDLRTALMLDNQADYQFITPTGAPGGSTLYDALYHATDRNPQLLQDYSAYTPGQARSSGHYGYTAIRLSLSSGVPVPPADTLSDVPTPWAGPSLADPLATNDPSFAAQYGVISPAERQRWDFDLPAGNNLPTAAEVRYGAYLERQVALHGAFFAVTNTNQTRIANRGLFGLDDLLELLKYGGANDSTFTSSLEMVVGGRGMLPGGGPPAQASNYSPLRDNRTLFNERPERVVSALTNDDQWEQFRLAKMIDIRQRLTTLSWAREIRLGVDLASPDHLADSEVRVNPISLLAAAGTPGAIRNYLSNANVHRTDRAFGQLFNAYLSALSPYITEGNETSQNYAWGSNAGILRKGLTLSYGHQGAEFAFITSALLAANMQEKFDSDSIPQGRTLLIDNDFRNNLVGDSVLPLDQQLYPWWHSTSGDADAHLGDPRTTNDLRTQNPGELKLASSARGDAINAQAINIFGVEPQVFVTGSTTFTVYTDAPPGAAGGADDEGLGNPITIRGAVVPANTDFVMRVVAFQLTNPFNVDVQLGANELGTGYADDPTVIKNLGVLDVGDPNFPPLTRLKDYFYLEFGGRQYALVRLEDQRDAGTHGYIDPADGIDAVAKPIIVPAGETVVVYALSQLPREILKRMKKVDEQYPIQYMTVPVPDPVVGGIPIPRFQSPFQFHQLIRKHIADRGLGIGRPTVIANPDDPANPFDATFEQDGVYWIPEFFSPMDNAGAGIELGMPGMTRGTPDATGGAFKSFAEGGPNTFGDLLTPASSSASPDNQVVKLWRCMRAGLDEPLTGLPPNEHSRFAVTSANFPSLGWDGSIPFNVPANATMYDNNDRHDDLLVDRLRLPSDADFNKNTTLGAGNNPVSGTDGLADDSGLTITLWDAAHRPADPLRTAANPQDITSGSLPAYCLERKLRVDAAAGSNSWNIHIGDDLADPPSPSNADFATSTGARGAGKSLRQWYNRPTGLAPTGTGADDVVVEPVGRSPALRPSTGVNALNAASRINITGPNGVEKPNYVDDRPELVVNNARYGLPNPGINIADCRLRTVDMLSPLAVGTINDPIAALPSNWTTGGLTVDDVQWTTLSESLCLALGYEAAPLPADPCAIRALYPQPNPSGGLAKRLYDHAQLKLDDYVAFMDADGDGQFAESIVQGNPANSEYRRGAQTPLAWNVLDVFSTRASTLDTVIPGLININTASQSVLASVPMLAPPIVTADPFLRPDPASGSPRDAWWGDAAALAASNPPPTFMGITSDLTATVAAARDKDLHFFRPDSEPAAIGPTISFAEAPIVANSYAGLQARTLLTGIAGIGEMPGFRTPGAILTARANAPDMNTAPVANPDVLPMNIDFLAHDVKTGSTLPADSSVPGVTPGLTRNWDDTAHLWRTSANLAGNDYQEKLAIAAAALGSTTNRSDTFAVWFLVQGYTKDDVTVGNANVPMVPSVKRRFVMVVDRSNVRQVGDKPRVLLFKEVPAD